MNCLLFCLGTQLLLGTPLGRAITAAVTGLLKGVAGRLLDAVDELMELVSETDTALAKTVDLSHTLRDNVTRKVLAWCLSYELLL